MHYIQIVQKKNSAAFNTVFNTKTQMLGVKLKKYVALFSTSLLLSTLWTPGYGTEGTADDGMNIATSNGLKRSADDAELGSDGEENDPKRRRVADLNTDTNIRIDFIFKRKRLEKRPFISQKNPSDSLLAYYEEQSIPPVFRKKMNTLYQAERDYVADTPDDQKENAEPVDINKEIVGLVINHEATVKMLLELSRVNGGEMQGEMQIDKTRLNSLIRYMTDKYRLDPCERYHTLIGYYALHIFSGFISYLSPEIRAQYINYLFATIAEHKRDITGTPKSVESPDYGGVRIFYANKILSPILINFDHIIACIPAEMHHELLRLWPYYCQLMVDIPAGLTWYAKFSEHISEEDPEHDWKNLHTTEWARDYLTGRVENFDFIGQLDADETQHVVRLLHKNAQLCRAAIHRQQIENPPKTQQENENAEETSPLGLKTLFEKLKFTLNEDILDKRYDQIYYNNRDELILTLFAPMIYTARCEQKDLLLARIQYATDHLEDKNSRQFFEDHEGILGLAILLGKHIYYFTNPHYTLDIKQTHIFTDRRGDQRYDITFFNNEENPKRNKLQKKVDARQKRIRFLQIESALRQKTLTPQEVKELQELQKKQQEYEKGQQPSLFVEFCKFTRRLEGKPLEDVFQEVVKYFHYFQNQANLNQLDTSPFTTYYMELLTKIQEEKKQNAPDEYQKYREKIKYNPEFANNINDEQHYYLHHIINRLVELGFNNSILIKDIGKIHVLFYHNKLICHELFSRNTLSSQFLSGITMHPEQCDLPLEERAPHFYGTIQHVFNRIDALPNDDLKTFFITKLVNDYNVDILCMEGKSSVLLKWEEDNGPYMDAGFNIAKVLETQGPLPGPADEIINNLIVNLITMKKLKDPQYQNLKWRVNNFKYRLPPIPNVMHNLTYQGVQNGEINNYIFAVKDTELAEFMKAIHTSRNKELNEYEEKLESDMLCEVLDTIQQLVSRQATDKVIEFEDIYKGLLCVYEKEDIDQALYAITSSSSSASMETQQE